MENYTVYKHTNKINQRSYFGMTKMNPVRRWGSNGIGYRSQPKFYEDIVKYGWNSFKHEILYTDLTKEEAHSIELKLIRENIENCYNANQGKEYWEENYSYQKKKVEKPKYYCIELDLTFETSIEAEEKLGIDRSSIIKACKGLRKSAGKHPDTKKPLHWRYRNI